MISYRNDIRFVSMYQNKAPPINRIIEKSMTSRRDWFLQQLGITQWKLRRPAILQGEAAMPIPSNIRLLIVAQSPPQHQDPLFCDLLLSLHLTPEQTYSLTPNQLAVIPKDRQYHYWYLGNHEPLTDAQVHLQSPVLNELYQDGHAKRALWQQICQYEKDFYPDAS